MRCRRGGPNTQRSEVQGVWREEDEMDGQTWAGLRMSSEQGRFRPSGQGATWAARAVPPHLALQCGRHQPHVGALALGVKLVSLRN